MGGLAPNSYLNKFASHELAYIGLEMVAINKGKRVEHLIFPDLHNSLCTRKSKLQKTPILTFDFQDPILTNPLDSHFRKILKGSH